MQIVKYCIFDELAILNAPTNPRDFIRSKAQDSVMPLVFVKYPSLSMYTITIQSQNVIDGVYFIVYCILFISFLIVQFPFQSSPYTLQIV